MRRLPRAVRQRRHRGRRKPPKGQRQERRRADRCGSAGSAGAHRRGGHPRLDRDPSAARVARCRAAGAGSPSSGHAVSRPAPNRRVGSLLVGAAPSPGVPFRGVHRESTDHPRAARRTRPGRLRRRRRPPAARERRQRPAPAQIPGGPVCIARVAARQPLAAESDREARRPRPGDHGHGNPPRGDADRGWRIPRQIDAAAGTRTRRLPARSGRRPRVGGERARPGEDPGGGRPPRRAGRHQRLHLRPAPGAQHPGVLQ